MKKYYLAAGLATSLFFSANSFAENLGVSIKAGTLGIGWGNTVEQNQNQSFSFDLGVIFQGSSDVRLRKTSSVAGLDTSLRAEEQQLEQSLDDFDIYPVLSLGVAWKF